MISWPDSALKKYFVVASLGLVSVCGCGESAPGPTNEASSTESASVAVVATESVQPDSPLDLPPSTEPSDTIVEEPVGKPAALERVILLTPGGPLVVDVSITLAGRPLAEVFDEVIRQVLDAGDTDGDGRATWQEWQANKEFLQGELAGAAGVNQRQLKQWIERYDENQDNEMQSQEAAGWLGRNSGGSSQVFEVRSSKSFSAHPALTSRVWQLLDDGQDGALSEEEVSGAPGRFWSFDADDDRTITLSEMMPLKAKLEASGGQRSSVARGLDRYAAVHLYEDFELDRLDSLLSDFYAPRQNLGPDSFPDMPNLFRQLDENQDQKLDRGELARLMSIEPALKLSIAFGKADESVGAATLNVEDHAAEIQLVLQSDKERVILSLGKTRLLVSVHELVQNNDAGQTAARSQVRLMVHDQCDALFMELDSDGDGRLGERELDTCGERLLQFDTNGDRRITSDELPSPMIVAFLRGEPASQRSFYVPESAAKTSRSDELPLWFLKADFNGDGDISRREFLGPAEQFSQLDSNQDGYISGAEGAGYRVE